MKIATLMIMVLFTKIFFFCSNWKNRKTLVPEPTRWVFLSCDWSLTSRSVQWGWLRGAGGQGHLTEGWEAGRPGREGQWTSFGTWCICHNGETTLCLCFMVVKWFCTWIYGTLNRQPSRVGTVGYCVTHISQVKKLDHRKFAGFS